MLHEGASFLSHIAANTLLRQLRWVWRQGRLLLERSAYRKPRRAANRGGFLDEQESHCVTSKYNSMLGSDHCTKSHERVMVCGLRGKYLLLESATPLLRQGTRMSLECVVLHSQAVTQHTYRSCMGWRPDWLGSPLLYRHGVHDTRRLLPTSLATSFSVKSE